jgi:uncharacterized protein YfkK (UPF0435 family)
MSISPKKNKQLTNLEIEALNMVNEELMEPEVTDEVKYEQLLQQRKNRKAGENLYTFLER